MTSSWNAPLSAWNWDVLNLQQASWMADSPTTFKYKYQSSLIRIIQILLDTQLQSITTWIDRWQQLPQHMAAVITTDGGSYHNR